MKSQGSTVEQYLSDLPEDRREAIAGVRRVILKHLPKGYQEGMQYGMIGYFVPHELYPAGYHCDPKQPLPFAGLGNQKNHMALYLFCLYTDAGAMTAFEEAWKATGKKLDMGKSCVRFKRLEDVPLEVVGKAIAGVPVKKFLERYEAERAAAGKGASKAAPKKVVSKKSASKTIASKKSTSKKAASKKSAKKSGRTHA